MSDPFDTTGPVSGGQSVQPSESRSLSSSPASIRVGLLFQAAALSVISYQWIADKIPVAWHAILAIVAVMLPTDSLTGLARGAIRGWFNRGSK